MRKTDPPGRTFFDSVARGPSAWPRLAAVLLAALLSHACGSSGSDLADNGGMSGTGISQGSVSAFGSIFVNGVEWSLSGATVEVDGMAGAETDLRLGMVVRIDGSFAADGLSGTANRVTYDDSIEGPIENMPVETIPGVAKSFSVLGQLIVVDAGTTIFDGGASFANLMEDDVVEVSGFLDQSATIRATRVERKGQFPITDRVELRGTVSNLTANANGTGLFDLGSILVRYSATTTFEDVTRASLAVGDQVEVEGDLVGNSEISADRVELEEEGLGEGNAEQVEIEGIVTSCPQSPDFCVNGVPVDASSATFEPGGFTPAAGDFVEVKGSLVNGTLVASQIESEDEEEAEEDVRIEAAVTSVDAMARTLVILGVNVAADGETRLKDESMIEDESFMFGEIQPGDFLLVEGIATGTSQVRALSIERDDAIPNADDVRLEGPVTAVDPILETLSVLGQPIPLDGQTTYFDDMGQPIDEQQFFRDAGAVLPGDIVEVKDEQATDLSALGEADEVSFEDD